MKLGLNEITVCTKQKETDELWRAAALMLGNKMQRVEKQLGLVQSVMYLLTQVGRRELLDHSGADNEEVNKRNGTLKCSSTTQVPQFNL